MRRTINNVISVIFTFVKFCILKLFLRNNFKFSLIERFSPNVVTEFNKKSTVEFGKKVRVHSGSKIKVRSNAQLFIGNGVKINYNCIIACHNNICIEDGTEFGPSVYIYDHDHDYKVGLKENKFKVAPVHIGKNCWIGANTVILRGTELGDSCVVGAGTILKGKYKSGSIIIQKKETMIKEDE